MELLNYGKGWFSLATESESEIVSGIIRELMIFKSMKKYVIKDVNIVHRGVR